jgi:23S rRNA (guanine2445-N2)-methyltransferase / 23S rRNA (guanine2069-N7)-methyltransferase
VPGGTPGGTPGGVALEFYATCAKGAEAVLASELRALGVRKVRPLRAGVAFFGELADGYRACLWLRTASRVLLIVQRVAASDANSLYAGVGEVTWEEHLPADGTLAVDARGTNEALRDERFVALRIKDAICDRLREKCGQRPSVQRERPGVRINAVLRGDKLTLAIDLSGEPLHRRGYRVPSREIVAPLRETLAAQMLLGAGAALGTGAEGFSSAVGFVLDPLCGSGTIAIEAAWLLLDRAPGLLREYWGFHGWLGHDEELWLRLLDEADERAEAAAAAASAGAEAAAAAASAGAEAAAAAAPVDAAEAAAAGAEAAAVRPLVYASDIDPAAVEVARASARKAGVDSFIAFSVADVADLGAVALPKVSQPTRNLLACNPPYGERLAAAAQLPALYAALSQLIRSQQLAAVIITPDERIDSYLGQPAAKQDTFNGPLESAIRIWLDEQPCEQASSPSTAVLAALAGGTAADEQSPFANRLRKMAAHRGKWARRAGISCYRLYDADLPDYNLAIDLYQGATGTPDEGQRWLHIAEYAPPAEIDPARAAERLAEALRLAPAILGVPTSNVFLKQRRRAKGGSQYAETSEAAGRGEAASHLIDENGLLLEVELAQHLDTGIFLDHRPVRQWLREQAAGKDCLNLFAYTGAASVALAAGGANSVTTVDLSHTYLNWARRNLERNGFRDAQRYPCVQADAVRWVQEQRHAQHGGQPKSPAKPAARSETARRYGLIFVDPPTFSNSARMGSRSWDVQRDHAELLIGVSRLLVPGGQAVFSCNLRGFSPDVATLARAGVELEDITARTIPPDFERNPRIHSCYLLRRKP